MAARNGIRKTEAGEKVYWAWVNIKRRCYNPACKQYKDYGGRGIKLQAEWESDPTLFCSYVLSLPNFSLSMSIDRINNDGDYAEGNLQWSTMRHQAQNRRKRSDNTSGKTGVSVYGVKRSSGRIDTYALAQWKDGGKIVNKTFNVAVYGLMPAFAMAVRCRQEAIETMNKAGAAYSAKHGN
jgi:hypothetical protein